MSVTPVAGSAAETPVGNGTLFNVVEPTMERYASLSDDGLYRYSLTRTWDYDLPSVAFCMLNPSTADALIDDPTIRRCVGFARGWGYGSLNVVNMFAWRATDPDALALADDPIGPENDRALFAVSQQGPLVCAWGASVPHYWRHRPAAIVAQLRAARAELFHLGLTKDGHPRHPLYLRGDTAMTRWSS